MTAARPFLSARWVDLMMVNWRVDPALLEPHVPCGVSLDFEGGETFVSLVGFLFLDTHVRGWSIPFHRNFEEVNLRLYTRHVQEDGEVLRGVAFLREMVPRAAITWTARLLYGENYHTHRMRHSHHRTGETRSLEYAWRVRGRWHRLTASVRGEPAPLVEGSHEEFIAEHYWGHAKRRGGHTTAYQVEHPPWRVWPVEHWALDWDPAPLCGPGLAETLAAPPASVFVAEGSHIAVHPGFRLC